MDNIESISFERDIGYHGQLLVSPWSVIDDNILAIPPPTA
jgi:hypothetical protein